MSYCFVASPLCSAARELFDFFRLSSASGEAALASAAAASRTHWPTTSAALRGMCAGSGAASETCGWGPVPVLAACIAGMCARLGGGRHAGDDEVARGHARDGGAHLDVGAARRAAGDEVDRARRPPTGFALRALPK
eukprot:CAMPEP_0179211938 /NCGR_PEP_ID=MMETSP0797-20121207/780_1 /TAXON_ID=47934 /ORGANISM="Dinophysis acuminata, Strain DAEP01" /LENGTH=136 /DNA_ID=CAMNT_0020917399 /DNA_START=432 /DNA_END=841 /DNA_ORIENTATION=-